MLRDDHMHAAERQPVTAADLRALAAALRSPCRVYDNEPERRAAYGLAAAFEAGIPSTREQISSEVLANCARHLLRVSAPVG